MKRFLVFIALFCAFGVFLNSCEREQTPVEQTSATGEEFTIASASAHYCTTNAQFQAMFSTWNNGDTLYVHDSHTFSVPSTKWHGQWVGEHITVFQGVMWGTGDDQAQIQTGGWFSFSNADIRDVVFSSVSSNGLVPSGSDFGYGLDNDSTYFENVHISTNMHLLAGYGSVAFKECHFRDYVTMWGGGCSPTYFSLCEFDALDNVCSSTSGGALWWLNAVCGDNNYYDDMEPDVGGYGGLLISDWKYDGQAYTFADFDFLPGHQTAWIEGDTLVVVMPVVNEHGAVTGVLKYGDSNCTTYSATMDNTSVSNTPVPFGHTNLFARVDVSWYTGGNVYWKVEATLCDTTIVYDCTLKAKPKIPEDDPIPEEW